jgi:hypothetical protein
MSYVAYNSRVLTKAIAIGRLVDVLLAKTTLGQRLSAAARMPLRRDHGRWIAALCMLGALEAEVPEAALLNVLVAALGRGRLDGRTASMRESDVTPLLSAIVSPNGFALDVGAHGDAARLRSKALQDDVEAVVAQMDALGAWQLWPGLTRIRGDQRGLVHRLLAGIVSLLRPLAGPRCSTLVDLARLGLVTDPAALAQIAVGSSDELEEDAVLLEAEPSWGKTRKALAHGVRLWRTGRVEGITWALPTRRAAVHVYEQIRTMLPQGAPVAVLGLWAEGRQSDGRQWFLEPSYRYFAAPIGVTTLEQTYKAIRTEERHGYTRAAWLARNLLVVDGLTHADSRNLCAAGALMRNQRRLGGCSLALSSGLDAAARHALDLFTCQPQEPLGVDPKPLSRADLPVALAEPPAAVWSRSGDASPLTARPLPQHNSQIFAVRLVEPEDELAEEAMAIDLAARGHRVLRVCNTNRRCREVAFRVLQSDAGAHVIARAGPRNVPITYRSRYPASDLACIDAATRQCFDLSRKRSSGLLVATGLVDHSLDLSFDVVISDFAPADILLRRMGLLSRGPSSSWRPRPELHVLLPTPDVIADFASIYEDAEALERTHLHLIEGAISFSSRDLLERVYAGTTSAQWQRQLARARWLAPETHMLAFGTQNASTEPDPMFPRTEPRQRIAFPASMESPLGVPLVPMWIRTDEKLDSMQTVATYAMQLTTPSTVLDVLAWDGEHGHRLSSLGYWYSTEIQNTLDQEDDEA